MVDISIHDAVDTLEVAARSGQPVDVVRDVLGAQRQAVAYWRAMDSVVALCGFVLCSTSDPLAQWCRAHQGDLIDPDLDACEELCDQKGYPAIGDAAAVLAGCPPELVETRSVALLADVAWLTQAHARHVDFDIVGKVLEAFWDIAVSAPDPRYTWPYDPIAPEAVLEEWLVAHLDDLGGLGGVQLAMADIGGRCGRQWCNADRTARVDVLAEVIGIGESDGSNNPGWNVGDLVVIELKAGPLDGDAVGQASRYHRVVAEEVAAERSVHVMLIGAGAHPTLYPALDACPLSATVRFWPQVGYRVGELFADEIAAMSDDDIDLLVN